MIGRWAFTFVTRPRNASHLLVLSGNETIAVLIIGALARRSEPMREWLLALAGLFITLCVVPPAAFGQGPTIEEVAAIQSRHEAAIMALPGVVGVGISKSGGQMVLQVFVDKDAATSALPATMEGVPVTIMWISPPVTHTGGGGCSPVGCHSGPEALPTRMGRSTSNEFGTACTLGFKACDPSTRTVGFVTNNHCNPGSNGCENNPMEVPFFEPGVFDGGGPRCGTSERIVTLLPSGNKVDAAFVRSRAGLTRRNIDDIGNAARIPGTVVLGECIHKSGRTSGHTFGRVAAVNVTTNVGGYCQGVIQFIDQIMYVADTTCGMCDQPGPGTVPCPISQGGDSGSAVIETATRRVVGLNFAGPSDNSGSFGIGNHVQNVVAELGGLTLDLRSCARVAAGADLAEDGLEEEAADE
jgi:hypothetical protein